MNKTMISKLIFTVNHSIPSIIVVIAYRVLGEFNL